MTPRTTLSPEITLEYLGIDPQDHADCLALLEGSPSPAVVKVLGHLSSRLGSADTSLPQLETTGLPVGELHWISAMLRFAPEVIAWHAERYIPEAVTRATLADVGRNMAINRRVHLRFGMDTYKWLNHLFAGRIYQLGRLQYLIHQPTAAIPGVASGEWIVGVHIPEGGGLAPAAVSESLALAAPFFAEHFPEHPVATANCESWLLDPYLAEHLEPSSNIATFAARFTPYGEPRTEPSDAIYFTFRTRNMDHLEALPRTTALQRVVLERIDAGGAWQLGHGYLSLR
ncbi:acyltransferase domain-containing protein [Arthrobacter sp.]|uniref:acyltransferase domain-containing protein n=1 Tax=Arthrobacter sp. TaxID=1667 RepID=UPI0026DEAC3F|nr:acyltransferase domain-containing protein [Arthrobacter sp.]MDO5752651.1 acyltransferase domain-containing protein [Arthrobacter sp.]